MMTRGGAGAVLSETGERRGVRGAPDVEEPAESLEFGVAAALLAGAAGVADDPLEDLVGCLVFPSEPALFVLNWVVLAGLLSTFTSSGAYSTWARGREDARISTVVDGVAFAPKITLSSSSLDAQTLGAHPITSSNKRVNLP